MAQRDIRGSTQIKDASITAAKFVALLGLATSQLAEGSLFLKSDGSVNLTESLNANGQKIVGLGTPTLPGDAAPKSYVDAIASGLDLKPSVRAVALTNIVLSAPQTIDGVVLVAGDRVLLTGQTTPAQNGIWLVNAAAWTRPTDYATASSTAVTPGTFTFVEAGTVNADTGWVVTTDTAITVDTTATTWTQYSGAGQIVAGSGLTKTGSTMNVGQGIGLQVNADDVQVLANGASLNVAAAGIKISDGTVGQVMLAGPTAAFTTLSGDIASITAGGAVTLSSTVLKATSHVFNETPTGAVNGVNLAFTLAFAPIAGTVTVYLNGIRERVGAGLGYTVSGSTITFIDPPLGGADPDDITVDYLK